MLLQVLMLVHMSLFVLASFSAVALAGWLVSVCLVQLACDLVVLGLHTAVVWCWCCWLWCACCWCVGLIVMVCVRLCWTCDVAFCVLGWFGHASVGFLVVVAACSLVLLCACYCQGGWVGMMVCRCLFAICIALLLGCLVAGLLDCCIAALLYSLVA